MISAAHNANDLMRAPQTDKIDVPPETLLHQRATATFELEDQLVLETLAANVVGPIVAKVHELEPHIDVKPHEQDVDRLHQAFSLVFCA